MAPRQLDFLDIESIEEIDCNTVYDLTIEDNSNYYIYCDKPILVHNSTKTYSLLQVIKFIAENSKKGKLISFMGPTFPHIRRGGLRDFINILETDNQFNETKFNKTNLTFDIGNSQIEFFSSDAPEKVRGPRRDILVVNELNLIKKETFEQALIRTNECAFVDFNPVKQFYAHTELMPRSDCKYIHSTFRDNPFLNPNIVDEILQRKKNKNWWRVYGMGEVGEVEGLVYDRWEIIKSIPDGANLLGYGMDFGYTNSKTALVAIYSYRDKIILHELIYKAGLLSKELIDLMKGLNIWRNKRIIADSEDPRLIQEIKNAGFLCVGIKKPKVFTRIEKMKNQDLLITDTSTNLITELQNYMWQEVDGVYLQEPVKDFDHLLDASGYGIWELIGGYKLNFI